MLLEKAERDGEIHGVSVCRGAPRVSHLFFADDSILFAKATLQECSRVADIISKYERASGQMVNLSKTEVAFSKNVTADRRRDIIETLGVREVDRHEKYLGLPTIIGRSKKAVFACLKERIWKKLQGWKEKLLSRPGKEIMIKAVAQAIPTYMMSIFKIPEGLIDEIHSMFARFWWGSTDSMRKLHWHKWETLCLPKTMGGLGFRDLKSFNLALLAKQGWRLIHNPGSLLHMILQARYFKNGTFMDAHRGYNSSFSWRSIWGAKELLMEGLKWRVGNWANIRVWEDAWLPGRGSHIVPTPNAGSNLSLRVCDLISFETGRWLPSMLSDNFSWSDQRVIQDIPLSQSWCQDVLYWWPNKDGVYTVRSGYWLARGGYIRAWQSQHGSEAADRWRHLWKVEGPPKLQHFLWRACKGSLAVRERLKHRHITMDALCPICEEADETITHSLFFCKYAKEIWASSELKETILQAPSSSFAGAFEWIQAKVGKENFVTFVTLCWAAWLARNTAIFETIIPQPVSIARGLMKLVHDYVEYAQHVFVPKKIPGVSRVCKWSPPPADFIKLNVDAHIMGDMGVGLGVVARNSSGHVVGMAVCRCSARWEVSMAEAAAVKFGTMVAGRLGFRRIVVESDAENVVRCISQGVSGYAPIFLFL